MDTLLVVEDEKMIRRGICVMAQRASVQIGEILECRNGLEALDILKERKIDTVFTDIRMPKMDGIELVKEMEHLEHKPDVVVVSGYDDFNYAVEMLKCGASDYILKPVKREKIEEILQKLEKKQRERGELQQRQEQVFYSQIRCFLTSELSETEKELAAKAWQKRFGGEPYVAIVYSEQKAGNQEDKQGICIDAVGHQSVRFLQVSRLEEWKQKEKKDFCGVSLPAVAARECRQAYEQARRAREKAFVRGSYYVVYEDEKSIFPKKEGVEAEKLVRQFSGTEGEEAVKTILNMCFQARHGAMDSEAVLSLLREFSKKLIDTYRNLIQEPQLLCYQEPLLWDTLEEYEEYLEEWLGNFSECLLEQLVKNQNQRKMQEAVTYIRRNYKKDLNMAMVSNYVSMNYSLFSIAFKNYTGVNFVNYLKKIRIEEAKKLLEETEMKVQEIGKAVGYENDKHFMKTFKSLCGVSPSEYRRNCCCTEETTE